ncbi:MAG: 2-succinyl-5-enolpyruvyl-6-hydroxy-3-cyclohexene-1-carboxylic-acid synthase [Flavobacteriaceae bacterium]
MKYSSIPSAQSLVQHFKGKGIKNIVISPGSRNAPLIIGFSEDPYFKCFSIVDERCAAFFALGIAQQLREPVAAICTSGSALLNYYPAVAEAFYSNIPLIVISADRPLYKIDVGDGQTIRQDYLFEKHIGYSTNLKQDVIHAKEKVRKYIPQYLSKNTIEAIQDEVQKYNDGELNTALSAALRRSQPVHINIPFEEPLYNTVSRTTVDAALVFDAFKDEKPIKEIDSFRSLWGNSKRKMVLVGVNDCDTVEQDFLNILAKDPSVIVLTETTSNLHHPDFFPSIDSIIAPIEKSENREELFEALQPDILLTFGGLIISKKIKAFLRQYKPEHHWHVGSRRAYDTFFSLTHHIKTSIDYFISELLGGENKTQSNYFSFWDQTKKAYEHKRKAYIDQISFSDLLAFHHITKNIPEKYHVQLANSSTVRYMQLFDLHSSISVFCNRGTSGIDGSTSTAIGASIYSQNPTLLITGDLSFFYDSNGLWNNYLRSDFRIILINNQGGGIFRILPGQEDDSNFENYFETVHKFDARQLCTMHNIEYFNAIDVDSMQLIFETFYEDSNRSKLVEIRTPRLLNNKILIGYFDFIS